MLIAMRLSGLPRRLGQKISLLISGFRRIIVNWQNVLYFVEIFLTPVSEEDKKPKIDAIPKEKHYSVERKSNFSTDLISSEILET
jgi:hypothetical protein